MTGRQADKRTEKANLGARNSTQPKNGLEILFLDKSIVIWSQKMVQPFSVLFKLIEIQNVKY